MSLAAVVAVVVVVIVIAVVVLVGDSTAFGCLVSFFRFDLARLFCFYVFPDSTPVGYFIFVSLGKLCR